MPVISVFPSDYNSFMPAVIKIGVSTFYKFIVHM